VATFLHRLGRRSFRRRHLVALLWAALLAIAGAAAAVAPAAGSSSFAIPGTEAQKAFDLLAERFPGSGADGATGRLVLKAPDGERMTDAPHKATVEQTVEELGAGAEVVAVTDPYTTGAVSKDGTVAYLSVSYDAPGEELSDDTRAALEAAAEHAREGGLTAEIGGDALRAGADVGGTGEAVGLVIAAVVLVLTLGSLIAAGLPLLTALVGVGTGVSVIAVLAKPLDLGDTTSTLALMIGLAVGIDYALFIVSRYRSELAEGHDREEAAGRAVGTAGSAVVFAGLTVVIALAGLGVVGVPILTKMGFAAAGTVVVAVLVALTLVPALLGHAGHRVRPAGERRRGKGSGANAGKGAGRNGADGAEEGAHGAQGRAGLGTRWASFVVRRPVAVLLLGVAGLGAVALPVTRMELGLPDDGTQPASTTQRRAYDLLSEGFGPGFNGPLVVLGDARGAQDPQAAADEVVERTRNLDDVVSVAPAAFNKAGDTFTVTVVPASKPASGATEDLVHAIRAAGADIRADTGAQVFVTGSTAMNIDFSQKVSDALVPYLALVVGLAFLLLIVVFRSVLVPLKAALGFLLSVLAALGAVVAVFQWGRFGGLLGVEETGPIMSLMPVFMVGVVFGLAMDYEVFLVTRMREAHVHGENPVEAVRTGFRHSSRVVVAAAVIMMAVFGGFVTAAEPMIKMIGFGLAIAVLFDAFVVRMAIVPAVLVLLGERAWWLPAWLDRVLPHVDVEGESLRTAEDAHTTHGEAGEDGEDGRGDDRRLVGV
jgi:RND superfamily putative drug exporter